MTVYKLDRFSRNKYEMAIHRKHLKDNGIKILSAKENIPETPEGVLLGSLLEGMNQYYSEELSQKTKRGMRETRLKGNFIGGTINYGYSLQELTADINGKPVRTALKVITMNRGRLYSCRYLRTMPTAKECAISLKNSTTKVS